MVTDAAASEDALCGLQDFLVTRIHLKLVRLFGGMRLTYGVF